MPMFHQFSVHEGDVSAWQETLPCPLCVALFHEGGAEGLQPGSSSLACAEVRGAPSARRQAGRPTPPRLRLGPQKNVTVIPNVSATLPPSGAFRKATTSQAGAVGNDGRREGLQHAAVALPRAAQILLAFAPPARVEPRGPEGQEGGGHSARDLQVVECDVVGVAEEAVIDQFPGDKTRSRRW